MKHEKDLTAQLPDGNDGSADRPYRTINAAAQAATPGTRVRIHAGTYRETVNIIHDRLYIEYGKTDMTAYLNRRGMVFVDGRPMRQVALYYLLATTENAYWVEANGQKVHIRLAEVRSDEKVCTDYYGNLCGKKRVPGPIDNLQDKKARFSIDPRKPA